MKRDKIAFSVLAFIAMLMVLAAPVAATDNVLYFNPDNSSVSGYCSSVDVQVMADISESNPASATSINITFDPSCVDVTNWALDGGWDSGMDSSAWSIPLGFITISTAAGPNPPASGSVPLGTLTLHCNDTNGCCGSWLNFALAEYTNASDMATIVAATDDGTFMCGDAITVTKKVLDGSVWVDALGPLGSEWLNKDVIFNITVTAGCMPLSNLVVSDVMDSGLEYNDNASPGATSNTTNTATWNLGSLSASTSTSIEFNATIVGYGTSYNDATATAGVTDLGELEVSATDDARVTIMPPAGIEVNKTVWNPVTGEWVDVLAMQVIDELDIGDPASEAGHNLQGWGPALNSSCSWSGSGAYYGGMDGSGDLRVTWAQGNATNCGDCPGVPPVPTYCSATIAPCCGDDGNDSSASFEMNNIGHAKQLQLRVLDGAGDDNFDVYVNGILAYSYTGAGGTEDWVTHNIIIPVSQRNVDPLVITVDATADPWSGICPWGQLAINWAKLYTWPQICDTYRFKCEMHNIGSPGMALTDVRFWDIMSNSLEYVNNATITTPNGVIRDITLPGDYVFKPIYLHLMDDTIDISDPISSIWHELWPEYCNEYHLTSWHDNGDGYLSECDQIDMTKDGGVAWYQVNKVMFTLWVENETTMEEMYLDSEIDYYPGGLTDPLGNWHEIYPDFCKNWTITDWIDSDANGTVDYCDYVYIENLHDCGKTGWYHVLDVTIDLEVSHEWLVDDFLQDPLTLHPGQTVTVEFDAHVVDYGYDCNVQYAKGWCEDVGQWVYGEDNACIDTPKPDLDVTAITVNYDASGVKNKAMGPLPPGTKTQSNNLSAVIAEINGVDITDPFDVTFEIDGDLKCTVTVPGLAAGATTTVCCDNQFFPIADVEYTITVTADPVDVIPETDEGNNDMDKVITAQVNGYKGDGWQDGRNITNLQCHEQGTINLVYSTGDSAMYSAYYEGPWTTYTANWTPGDFGIPATDSCIKKARLYVYYNYDKTIDGDPTNDSDGCYFNLTFNGIEQEVDAHYWDSKGFPSYNYPYGMIAYDVADRFMVLTPNHAELTYTWPTGTINDSSITGMLLVVVYNNTETEPDRIIWINEGYDNLYARDYYGVSSEEATTYAEFEGCEPIPVDEVVGATLITVAPHANEGGEKNKLTFNGGEWYGVWDSYDNATELSINKTDVRTHLQSTDNTAAFQSHKSGIHKSQPYPYKPDRGDSMEASNAFLVVEKGDPGMSVEPEPPESGGDCYNVNERFSVLINITPRGKAIMGAQFDLHFNASVLWAETVTYGDFLTRDGASVTVSHSDVDNLNGVVSFAAARQGTTIGVTTPGTFAIVEFTAVIQDATSELDLMNALAADNNSNIFDLLTTNGNAKVCSNPAPDARAKSDFRINNIAERGLSKAYFNGTESTDTPPGTITEHEWWVDDGTDLVGMVAVHLFEVPMYWVGDQYGGYVPANVTLTVIDDGEPLMEGSDTIPVTVWIAGDTNGDGVVNIGDTVTFGIQFGKQAEIGPDGLRWYNNLAGDRADLNNDEWVNIGDAMLLGTSWGHTAW